MLETQQGIWSSNSITKLPISFYQFRFMGIFVSCWCFAYVLFSCSNSNPSCNNLCSIRKRQFPPFSLLREIVYSKLPEDIKCALPRKISQMEFELESLQSQHFIDEQHNTTDRHLICKNMMSMHMNSTGGWRGGDEIPMHKLNWNIYDSLVYKYAESEMRTSLSMIMTIGPSIRPSVCRDDNVLEIETGLLHVEAI